MIRKIIRAGKDVITTKPFELDAAEAKSVITEALALKRRIVLNSPGPLLPQDLQQIHSWIQDYDLGHPVAARADTWAHYREVYQGSWYDDPVRCPLAPVFRLGVYLINDLVEFLGEATEVAVLQSQVFTQRPTPDNAQLGILFKNGAIANVYASFCVNDGDLYRDSLTLNFEHGTIYRDVGFRKESLDAEMGLVMRVDGERKCVAKAQAAGRSGDYQWQNFYELFHGDVEQLAASYRKIVAGVEILDLTKKSSLSKAVFHQ